MYRILRAVHKDILLATVSMHIYECQHFVLILRLQIWLEVSNNFFNGADNRMESRMWRHVSPVEVVARHGHAVVSSNNAIGVGARNYLEN